MGGKKVQPHNMAEQDINSNRKPNGYTGENVGRTFLSTVFILQLTHWKVYSKSNGHVVHSEIQ